jgi:hypothetical protein
MGMAGVTHVVCRRQQRRHRVSARKRTMSVIIAISAIEQDVLSLIIR